MFRTNKGSICTLVNKPWSLLPQVSLGLQKKAKYTSKFKEFGYIRAWQELNGKLEEHPYLFPEANSIDGNCTPQGMCLGAPVRNNSGLDRIANRPKVTYS